MKTKLQIIQALLDESKITAEEAVTLMQVEKERPYVDPHPHYTTGSSRVNTTEQGCSTTTIN